MNTASKITLITLSTLVGLFLSYEGIHYIGYEMQNVKYRVPEEVQRAFNEFRKDFGKEYSSVYDYNSHLYNFQQTFYRLKASPSEFSQNYNRFSDMGEVEF